MISNDLFSNLIFFAMFNSVITEFVMIMGIGSVLTSKYCIVICFSIMMIFASLISIPHAIAQSTSLVLYDNKQYGFSIKYPSDWQKQEQMSVDTTFPNIFDIVTFRSPTQLTQYGIMVMTDNTSYRGLNSQEFLDKMSRDFGDSLCDSSRKTGVTCTSQIAQKTTLTHQNGYSGFLIVNSLTISNDKQTIQPTMIVGMYPDGDKIWVLVVLAFSSDEATNIQNTLSSMGSSFTIYNYQGATSVNPSTTSASSSFGSMSINSSVYYASKYSSDTIIVSGKVSSIMRGTPITLTITKPDGTADYQAIVVKKDGAFSAPVILNENWKSGIYYITAVYGDNEIGSVVFQVMSGSKPTQEKTPAIQNQQTLLYTNSQYGVSIRYPSLLIQSEGSSMVPNGVNVATFTTQSNMTGVNIDLVKNDSTFSGLTDSEFLEKMKEQYDTIFCKYFREQGNTCTFTVNTEEKFTSRNGYVGYRAVYMIEVLDSATGSKFRFAVFPALFPVGSDIWVLAGGSYSGEELTSLGKDLDTMLETFTISDYITPNIVFNSKAIQKDDTVYLVILNPSSSDGIYRIKISSNEQITNFIMIPGWASKRLDSNSIIYQTNSYPVNPSDVFKVKLKIDGKNPEIQWEVFSKDQKSLSTGRTLT